jgi:putative transposase
VITTKYRRKIFTEKTWPFFRDKFYETSRRYPEIEIQEINHDRDHVHLMLSIPPKMSVGSVVKILKGNTSIEARKAMKFLREGVYYRYGGIWSDSYFVSTTGINAKALRKYIEMQGQEDCGQAKLEL